MIDSNCLNSPNIQTSLAEVNLLKLIDSGAIHLIGSLPLEADTKTNIKITSKLNIKCVTQKTQKRVTEWKRTLFS